jgi:hypothetical protein
MSHKFASSTAVGTIGIDLGKNSFHLVGVAPREGKVERHFRLLAPLAFIAPRIISQIIDGTAWPDVTVTGLAKGLAHSWVEQEHRRRVRVPRSRRECLATCANRQSN